jgi:hypothetical protein
MRILTRPGRNFATAFALLFWLCGSVHSANARCYVPTPAEAFTGSDLVFVGKVLAVDDPNGPGQQLGRRVYDLTRRVKVHFAVERVFRGLAVEEISLETRLGGLEWGYAFEVRERYLVYAKQSQDRGLIVSPCGRTRPATNAAADLSFILSQTSPNKISIRPAELTYLVHQEISSKAKPALGMISEPVYVLTDFNGDGYLDVAIVVSIEQGRDELKAHGVHYLDVDPFSKTNGRELEPNEKMGQNCLGLAILHGSSKQWDLRAVSDKFITYDCFSSIRQVPKGAPIRRGRRSTGPPPRLKGDAILLDLESGAQSLVYWDGKTYHGFSIRRGD